MRQEDIDAIEAQDEQTLAEWYCSLNSFICPDGLEDLGDINRKSTSSRGWDIMCNIESIIGRRATSREWNKNMTDEEFNDFYAGVYENDEEAHSRYEKRLGERAKKELADDETLDLYQGIPE
jgi:hypothetical protein